MWPGHMGGLGWGELLLVGLLMLIFWGGVIAITVLAVRAAFNGSKQEKATGSSTPNPIQLLKERYARGEIDREEYLRIRQDLEA